MGNWRSDILARLNPKCRLCPLSSLQGGTHVCVAPTWEPGSKPRIMLIGEAPGEAESRTGESFRGASGQWMRQQIAELGIEREVYITNVVKCRPPDNRTPEDNEIAKCANKYLYFELQQLEPLVILTLGTTVRIALGFIERSEYPNNRKFYCTTKYFQSYVGITWHPAYCLRSGKQAQHDFRSMIKWSSLFVRKKRT